MCMQIPCNRIQIIYATTFYLAGLLLKCSAGFLIRTIKERDPLSLNDENQESCTSAVWEPLSQKKTSYTKLYFVPWLVRIQGLLSGDDL